MPGGASKAVVSDHYGSVIEVVRIDIPEEEWFAGLPLHAELLVEVAIVDLAAPTHAEGITAHHAGDGRGVEGANEQLHVGLQLSVMPQPGGKATDRHVRDRVEMVKVDIEMALQFALIIRFKLCLIGREKCTVRIVNEVKAKIGSASVSDPIEELKRTYARVEDPFAALSIDIGGFVAWHRGDDFHAMGDEKISKPFIARFNQDGEITSVDDCLHLRHFAEPFDKITKIGNHLRRAPREVNRMNVHASRPINDAVNGLAGHDFLPLGACIYVTMDAGQIAELAQIELKDFSAISPKRESVASQRSGERSPDAMIQLRGGGHLSGTILSDLSLVLPSFQRASGLQNDAARNVGMLPGATELPEAQLERFSGRNYLLWSVECL